jgi:hypothetical protein
LSQTQDGVARAIAYASLQLNKAEQTYSDSEIEMLALVWATKQFRCYLFGKTFLERNEHAALKYLRNFADKNSPFMCWSLRLSEFDFIVQHKAGTKISHVNALSRHVGVVFEEGFPSNEKVLAEKMKDNSCNTKTENPLDQRRIPRT